MLRKGVGGGGEWNQVAGNFKHPCRDVSDISFTLINILNGFYGSLRYLGYLSFWNCFRVTKGIIRPIINSWLFGSRNGCMKSCSMRTVGGTIIFVWYYWVWRSDGTDIVKPLIEQSMKNSTVLKKICLIFHFTYSYEYSYLHAFIKNKKLEHNHIYFILCFFYSL